MEAVQTAIVSSLTEIGTNMSGTITAVLPIALGLIGTMMVVTFGVKLFKKLTNKA